MTPQEKINEEESSGDESELASAQRIDAIHVIDQFGGIRPMAAKIGVAVTTVQGWKNRAAIPPDRWEAISAAAAKHGVDLKNEVEVEGEIEEAAATETVAPPESLTPESSSSEGSPPQIEIRTGGGVAWIALVASLAAVTVATKPYWGLAVGLQGPAQMSGRSAVQDLAVAARIDKLATRLTALETEMAGLPARLADTNANPELLQKLDAVESTVAARMTELETRLTAFSATPDPALNQRLDLLEAGAAKRSALQTALTTTRDRLQAVEQSLAAAVAERAQIGEQLSSAMGASGAVATLNRRVGVLSTDLAAIRKAQHVDTDDRMNNRSAALTLALSGLESVLTTDRPFQLALTALRDVAGDQASQQNAGLAILVAPIEPFAETGAPTLAQLTRQYRDLAPVLARRESVGGRKDWVGQTLDRIYDVVSWRQVGGPIDQAADALAGRDLKGAVKILMALPDFEPVARDWLFGARNRITVMAALDGLRARMTASQTNAMQKQPGQNQPDQKQETSQ
jgi:hypothetical protein